MPIMESYAGAWQQNVEVDARGVLANPFIFRCQAMIARDISKLRVKLMTKDGAIWKETTSAAFSPVLRKPNAYQTRNQFWESYFLSKLSRGNTYVLKQRDARRVVTRLHVLDPQRVTPLVSDSGEVFYQLATDNLASLEVDVTVPASEIIHDRWNCLFHPLVGLSPIWANGVAATQAQKISESSTQFFANQSRPGGILSAPGKISDETAARLKAAFETNYSGENAGKIAVVGDGLSFNPLTVAADDAQLVEQLKWTSETIATTFGIPHYKIGLGAMPTANNLEALNVEYYSQTLQGLIEDAESCLNEALGLDENTTRSEFDLDGLLRMDSATQMETLKTGVGAGIIAPNEGRAKFGYGPVAGGEMPYLQQQNYSLEALAKRDAQPDPWGAGQPARPAAPEADDEAGEMAERAFVAETLLAMRKAMEAA
ncbi:phage portal protein, HK97 family [Salipiger abyssi]|uniref:Phage portal protein, HK97 family n=2 Tax=Salipiger abyssi TaxID=1250539 RepID=A0A1P8UUR4_9RHOB|nr:phage portal protein, HK97 family [Salipiger abyssi]